MLEWLHRLIAGVILGPLLLLIGVLAWRARAANPRLPLYAAGLLLLLLVQAGLGGLTVLDQNSPWSVALHLGTALLLFSVLWLIVERAAGAVPGAGQARGLAVLTWLLALGTMVSAAMMTKSGASLACASWPLCNDALLPELGDPAVRLNLTHRLLAAATGLGSLALLLRLRAAPALRRLAGWAVGAMALEIALGGLVVLLGVPMWSGLLHQAFGVLTFALLSRLMWRAVAPAPATVEEPSMSAYRALEARFKRLSDLRGALAVLHWDRQTMMPAGGNAVRADQVATLQQIAHEWLTSAQTGTLLEEASEQAGELDAWQAANLREMRRGYLHAAALDPELVAAQARATARAEMLWRKARAAADFALLRPALEEVLDLAREEAVAKAAVLGLAPYDALLDGYEPGLTSQAIDGLLDPLAELLPDFIEQVLSRQRDPLPIAGPFPAARQKALGERLMARLGFDFDHGRLDESLHPFCGGVPDDVRMTARYDESDAASGLMAVLHETGHALYNAGLPKAWRGQPVGRSLGMVAHESQSLLLEMQVCRSRAFLGYLAPLLAETFGADPAPVRRQPLPAGDPGRAQPDPGRRRRGHLSAPRRAALSPGEGAAGGRSASGRPARRLERGPARRCSASARRTTARAASRTSTGRPAPSPISPATRSAR